MAPTHRYVMLTPTPVYLSNGQEIPPLPFSHLVWTLGTHEKHEGIPRILLLKGLRITQA
jgi:hypothetical protein